MKSCLIGAFSFLVFQFSFNSAFAFHNVLDMGVRNDGKTLNTLAINRAIEKVASEGGGTLYFPAGDYLSCSINLKSNITLYLDNGAVLIAAKGDGKDNVYGLPRQPYYPEYQDYGHSHWENALIYGRDLTNVSIVGQGTIYGRDLIFVDPGRNSTDAQKMARGDKAIGLVNCRDVVIRDISVIKGGWFALLATGVDNLTIDNVTVDTNRDGFDIDCCQGVRITNCKLNTPKDDAIVLKSSYALGHARATENVMITNCHVTAKFGSEFRGEPILSKTRYLGSIKFGTESNGGFKNIAVSNCILDHSVGILLESADGGFLENVSFSNIVMRDVNKTPLFIRTCARMRGPQGTPVGHCRRITLSNITAYNVVGVGDNEAKKYLPMMIMGIPDSFIEDVTIDNVKVYFNVGGTSDMVEQPVGEQIRSYPDPGMWTTLPSYGLYVRHARNVSVSNVRFYYLNKEERPPFYFENVDGIVLDNIQAQNESGNPNILLRNVKNFRVRQMKGVDDIYLESADTRNL